MREHFETLQNVFRDLFDDADLVLTEDTTADDIGGWDSLAHINLIVALEQAFGVRFATAEIGGLKESGQNVGSLLELIEAKLAKQ